jgi:hypothetical protein
VDRGLLIGVWGGGDGAAGVCVCRVEEVGGIRRGRQKQGVRRGRGHQVVVVLVMKGRACTWELQGTRTHIPPLLECCMQG